MNPAPDDITVTGIGLVTPGGIGAPATSETACATTLPTTADPAPKPKAAQ
ncbi:hypothetical protein [Streptomyces sp. SID13726]|nr:hypothetical protein [Streptomyces sp. SID13726]NEB00377.1 hypothetical protein [Streptomyces sp. SID13726]